MPEAGHQPPPSLPHKRRRRAVPFALGVAVGAVGTLLVAGSTAFIAYAHLRQQARTAAVFANIPPPVTKESRVLLYFPLQRFLAWRSRPHLELELVGQDVRIQTTTDLIPLFGLTVQVDVVGRPAVERGHFILTQVHGYVDYVPVPKPLILAAVAREGVKLGVTVDEARDLVSVDRSFGAYRLIAYDARGQDLVISVPVRDVLQAAQESHVL
ncbi:MAG: hypothetical protein OWT27_02485 [Firmicutes bacterium]|nr:hypothetical protein [Bacillota bacterium]